jgi:hypothetical protein
MRQIPPKARPHRARLNGEPDAVLNRAADGDRPRVTAKRRDSVAHGAAQRSPKCGAAQRNPGISKSAAIVALKGRHSPIRRRFAIPGVVRTRGITPFQGYGGCVGTRSQGFTLGYRITHLRCYGLMTPENRS